MSYLKWLSKCYLTTCITVFCVTAECDYNHEPFNVTIPAGEKEWPFDAIIYDDDIYETNEYFVLVIDEDSLPDRIEREQPYTSTVTIEDDEESKYIV